MRSQIRPRIFSDTSHHTRLCSRLATLSGHASAKSGHQWQQLLIELRKARTARLVSLMLRGVRLMALH